METFEYVATVRVMVAAKDVFAGKQKVDDLLSEIAFEIESIEEVR
jgi:hypothetical protein